MERVAITGPTGMLGATLTDFLAARDIEVLAIVNPESKRMDNLSTDYMITQVPCSMDEYGFFAEGPIARKLPRCDTFYHFAWTGTTGAARNNEVLQLHNVENSCDAVRLAHALGCKRFIFAGSQAEYGLLDEPFGPDTPTNPVTAYGRNKLAAGERTRELCEELGMEHIWVRIGSVYGPCDHENSVIIQALFHAWHEEEFDCTAGEQMWDHLHCNDAADAFYRIGTDGKPGAIYPLGSGTAEPLREHIQMACEVANPNFTPNFGALDYPENSPMYLCADISTLSADTGFEPLYTFADGIMSTAEWYRDELTKTPEYSWEKVRGLDQHAQH